MTEIILASASPRRRELLSRIGVRFAVEPAKGEEQPVTAAPRQAVKALARQKAEEVSEGKKEGTIVIGADTIVVFEGQVLGKPKDQEDAFRMLSMLQGNRHHVYTGVCVLTAGQGARAFSFCEKTEVEVYPMSEEEIRDYIRTGEPMDKAGAYGIQGRFSMFIKGIKGDYQNVVGLPVGRLYQECRSRGICLYREQ